MRIIPNSATACLFLLGALRMALLTISGSSIFPNILAVIILLPGLILWQKGKIGGGDMKLLLGMGLYMGIWQMAIACTGMLVPCLMLLLSKAIRKEKLTRIPLAPVLLMGALFPVVIGTIGRLTI